MGHPVIFHHFLRLFAVFALEMQFTEAIIFTFSDVLMMTSTLKNLNKNEDWQIVWIQAALYARFYCSFATFIYTTEGDR